MKTLLTSDSFTARLRSLPRSIQGIGATAMLSIFDYLAAKARRISAVCFSFSGVWIRILKRIIWACAFVLISHGFTSSISVAEPFTHRQIDELHRVCARKPYLWATIKAGRYLDCADIDLYQQLQHMERLRDAELLLKSDKQFLAAYAEYTSKEKYNGH